MSRDCTVECTNLPYWIFHVTNRQLTWEILLPGWHGHLEEHTSTFWYPYCSYDLISLPSYFIYAMNSSHLGFLEHSCFMNIRQIAFFNIYDNVDYGNKITWIGQAVSVWFWQKFSTPRMAVILKNGHHNVIMLLPPKFHILRSQNGQTRSSVAALFLKKTSFHTFYGGRLVKWWP